MIGRVGLVSLILCACVDYEVNGLTGTVAPPDPIVDDTIDDFVTVVHEASCDGAPPLAYAVSKDEECRGASTVGMFDPVVEWTWQSNATHSGYHQVMMTPVATLLDEDDTADILAIAFSGVEYRGYGALVGVSGSDGSILFSYKDINGCKPDAVSGIAVGDLDGGGKNSIIFHTSCGLMAIDRFGEEEWRVEAEFTGGKAIYWAPALADLDADGKAEVLWGHNVISHDGQLLWTGNGGNGGGLSFAADLDDNGIMEVIAGGTVYNADGTIRWDSEEDGYAAVADLDLDGEPEVIVVTMADATVIAYSADGVEKWRTAFPTDDRAGPPTVADFDGDGAPEIGIAFMTAYRVLDGDGSQLWSQNTNDVSSGRTGSAVFDFEGDGAAEVVYADEHTLYVYDGATGTIEMEYTAHESATIIEYPIIVDIDNDNSAEIVLASNDIWATGARGLTVIGDADNSWAPARKVWNQHAYHITNVNDDGSIPKQAEPNWFENNTFRAGNIELPAPLDRPDLHPGDPDWCVQECDLGHAVLYFPVENGGLLSADGVMVSLYSVANNGDRTLFQAWDAAIVADGEMQWIGPVTIPIEAFGAGGAILSVDDDGTGAGEHEECDETNNHYFMGVHPCLQSPS